MIRKVVCAVFGLLSAVVLCADRGGSCKTPNGEVATCTAISTCKIITDAVLTRNRDAIEFVKASQCGYDSVPLVCCGTSVQKSGRGSSCTTPNGEAGICTPLRRCKVVFDALATRNENAIEFVKKSQCGYDTDPLVCCGSAGNPPQVTKTTTFSSPLLPDRKSCGLTKSFRIVGGELTQIGEHPWMALLRYKNTDGTDAGFQCGGSIINKRYVLTAAHCVISRDRGIALNSVRLGESKISTQKDCEEGLVDEECADPVIDLKIEEKIVNRQYDRSRNGDIALLRLERNLRFTDYVRPICLPQPNSPSPATGTKLVVVGWGVTENGSRSDDKLKVQVPIVSPSECREKLKNRRRAISDNQICAGGVSGKDSCRGDSGGPLMGSFAKQVGEQDQWYQEGVVSWGINSCGLFGFPAIYTRVSRYMSWIVDNIVIPIGSSNSSCTCYLPRRYNAVNGRLLLL